MSNTVAPSVAPVETSGSSPAFFSCYNMQSYYGESYIVQGISFDVCEGELVNFEMSSSGS